MSAAYDLSHGHQWAIEHEGDLVTARFQGYLDGASGEVSAARFEAVTSGLDQFAVIFDVRGMDGYDNAARRAWGRVMQLRRKRILALETVGAAPIVRLGASLLGMLAGVQVHHRE